MTGLGLRRLPSDRASADLDDREGSESDGCAAGAGAQTSHKRSARMSWARVRAVLLVGRLFGHGNIVRVSNIGRPQPAARDAGKIVTRTEWMLRAGGNVGNHAQCRC
jgi:hypothetical protein